MDRRAVRAWWRAGSPSAFGRTAWSAATRIHRPGHQGLFLALRRVEIDVIVAERLDRQSRERVAAACALVDEVRLVPSPDDLDAPLAVEVWDDAAFCGLALGVVLVAGARNHREMKPSILDIALVLDLNAARGFVPLGPGETHGSSSDQVRPTLDMS